MLVVRAKLAKSLHGSMSSHPSCLHCLNFQVPLPRIQTGSEALRRQPSTGHHDRGGGGGGGGSGSGSGSTQAGRAPLSSWWMNYSTGLILAFPTNQSLDRDGHAPTSSALVACALRQKHSRPTPRTTGGEERPHQSGASPGMKMTRRKKEVKPAEQERGGEERRGNRNASTLTCLPSCGLADSG